MIYEKNAIKMIDFVLDASSYKADCRKLKRGARFIKGADTNRIRSFHLTIDLRN